jgi:hypothetical protein
MASLIFNSSQHKIPDGMTSTAAAGAMPGPAAHRKNMIKAFRSTLLILSEAAPDSNPAPFFPPVTGGLLSGIVFF